MGRNNGTGLAEALAEWRALPASGRAEILVSMRNDRDRLDEQSSNYVRPADIAHRNAVLATCDAAIGLLRAAAEPEAKAGPCEWCGGDHGSDGCLVKPVST